MGGRPRSEFKKTNQKNSQPFFHVVNFKCGTHRSKHRCVFLQTACRPPTCLNQHLFTKYATGLSLPCACQTSSSRCSSVPRPSKTKTRKGGGLHQVNSRYPPGQLVVALCQGPAKQRLEGGGWGEGLHQVNSRYLPGQLVVALCQGPARAQRRGRGLLQQLDAQLPQPLNPVLFGHTAPCTQ